MVRTRRLAKGTAALGVGMAALAGCQTYPAGFGGMTLPSPHYLKHQPQYFAPDPAFPLQRELNSMMDPEGAGRTGPGGPLAAPAPGSGVPSGQVQPPVPAPVQPTAPMGTPAGPPQSAPPITPPPGGDAPPVTPGR
jgi:hypothetical protein